MEEVKYLFSNGGIVEGIQAWIDCIKPENFTNSYEGLFEGKYMWPTEEQIAFYLDHKDVIGYYDVYHQFYMVEVPIEEMNETIRASRQAQYTAQTDKLYMAYVKYKEFGEEKKAEETYCKWKEAVAEIQQANPYFL